eukprot:296809-Rhodomonas_salina.1
MHHGTRRFVTVIAKQYDPYQHTGAKQLFLFLFSAVTEQHKTVENCRTVRTVTEAEENAKPKTRNHLSGTNRSASAISCV